jgi:precorrin-2 dehydrogenase / sirohydrochlorin ferrochelatase
MFPIALDLTRIPVLLAGHGELIERRLTYLDEAQAKRVTVFSPKPSHALKQLAGSRLIERLPEAGDITQNTIILLAGLPRETAEKMVSWARTVGKLVNVEDVNDLCDFFFTANVRRGDLIIAVSTSGASPTLARKLRDSIATRFGEEWEGRVKEMSSLRKSLKAKGASMREVLEASERYLIEKGWLKEKEDA